MDKFRFTVKNLKMKILKKKAFPDSTDWRPRRETSLTARGFGNLRIGVKSRR